MLQFNEATLLPLRVSSPLFMVWEKPNKQNCNVRERRIIQNLFDKITYKF